MAPHSSTLAWKIPWAEEPGRLQSMGSLRVGHDSDLTFTFHFHALEKEMATHSSVLAWRIPGKGSLFGCCLWGRTESDTTEATQHQQCSYVNATLSIPPTPLLLPLCPQVRSLCLCLYSCPANMFISSILDSLLNWL